MLAFLSAMLSRVTFLREVAATEAGGGGRRRSIAGAAKGF